MSPEGEPDEADLEALYHFLASGPGDEAVTTAPTERPLTLPELNRALLAFAGMMVAADRERIDLARWILRSKLRLVREKGGEPNLMFVRPEWETFFREAAEESLLTLRTSRFLPKTCLFLLMDTPPDVLGWHWQTPKGRPRPL
jgi:hypothetical protein